MQRLTFIEPLTRIRRHWLSSTTRPHFGHVTMDCRTGTVIWNSPHLARPKRHSFLNSVMCSLSIETDIVCAAASSQSGELAARAKARVAKPRMITVETLRLAQRQRRHSSEPAPRQDQSDNHQNFGAPCHERAKHRQPCSAKADDRKANRQDAARRGKKGKQARPTHAQAAWQSFVEIRQFQLSVPCHPLLLYTVFMHPVATTGASRILITWLRLAKRRERAE